SGNGGLIKNGSGTLILQGQHTYEGETQINSGTLALDGSNQSKAHIADSGTYQVKGSTGTVNNAGTFISRDATINGNFTQTADATFQTNLGSQTTINGT
ncbi:MAG: autotransporter-associated beta strand repeat-containing protein, partial [Snodgrassella sp.]|nr:autotransporter-associated beta strand repeat-containing protein [Snodgrassella sp.]